MQTIETISDMRTVITAARNKNIRIGFVPTMGNLHEGHLSLVRKAKEICDYVVASIYVNPLQFSVGDDLVNYPRTLAVDCDKLSKEEVDWVFIPDDQSLYPEGKDHISFIEVPVLDAMLEGKSRPRHFRGVATIVNKFFNIVQPDVAVFGEKDFQQLLVIQRMVADLNLSVEVMGLPTIREASGLAMSSRNGYLSVDEKDQASELYRSLCSLREKLLSGETDYMNLSAQTCDCLQSCGFTPEYVEVRRTEDLQVPGDASDKLVILAAASLGSTRLIDNLRV